MSSDVHFVCDIREGFDAIECTFLMSIVVRQVHTIRPPPQPHIRSEGAYYTPPAATPGSFEKSEGGITPKSICQKRRNSISSSGWRTVAVAMVRHYPLVDQYMRPCWLLYMIV